MKRRWLYLKLNSVEWKPLLLTWSVFCHLLSFACCKSENTCDWNVNSCGFLFPSKNTFLGTENELFSWETQRSSLKRDIFHCVFEFKKDKLKYSMSFTFSIPLQQSRQHVILFVFIIDQQVPYNFIWRKCQQKWWLLTKISEYKHVIKY